jgi:hypothetical protein
MWEPVAGQTGYIHSETRSHAGVVAIRRNASGSTALCSSTEHYIVSLTVMEERGTGFMFRAFVREQNKAPHNCPADIIVAKVGLHHESEFTSFTSHLELCLFKAHRF